MLMLNFIDSLPWNAGCIPGEVVVEAISYAFQSGNAGSAHTCQVWVCSQSVHQVLEGPIVHSGGG